MTKKKVSQKSLEYILLFAIVIIAAAAYRFGYMYYNDKAEAVETQNKALEARIIQLNEKELHRQDYIDAIAGADTKINEVLSKYGAGNTPEKSIIFVTKLEKAANMEIPSVSFYTDDVIYVSSAVDAEGNPRIVGYNTQLAITYSTTYKGLKDAMDFINNYEERVNVLNFTAVYNQETGGVSGSMNLGLYSVADENHEYAAPDLSGIKLGTDNIFAN